MKAEEYLARIIRKESGKTESTSAVIARRIVEKQVVSAIKEGPESSP